MIPPTGRGSTYRNRNAVSTKPATSERLEYGSAVVENFWLLIFITTGFCGFFIFLTGFTALIFWLLQSARARDLRLLILAFLITVSASNSLARKSTLLTVLVAAVLSAAPKKLAELSEQQVPYTVPSVL
jgi:hypothetical protein